MAASFIAAEQQKFEQEIAAVNKWFATERFRYVTRPYTAQDVVSKRGTITESYPSQQQAKKLWDLLQVHKGKRSASFTYGALDPIQVIQMVLLLLGFYQNKPEET